VNINTRSLDLWHMTTCSVEES